MNADDVFYRISMIMNVDQAEIAKIIHDYIERDIGCGTVYDRFNCPKPPIYIGPVKVKSLKERLEEIKMNATSIQNIKNVKDMSVTIEKSPLEDTRIIISVNTDDDTYEINCSGPECLEFLRKRDFVSIQEYDYIHSQLMEREKEVRELKQQLQKAERDKKSLAGSYKRLDNCYKGMLKDNKNLIKCKESLKSDLDLERAANEAQRKFIKEYAGKDTEVTFNYAIGSGPITYGLYDKDYIDELRKKNNNLIAENAEFKAKLCYKAKSADDIKKLKEQIKKLEEPSDNVNHPSHYTGKYECIDVMQDVFGNEATDNFCLCNAFKYIWRSNKKNGLEDVKKAVWYLNKYIEEAEKDGVSKGKQI